MQNFVNKEFFVTYFFKFSFNERFGESNGRGRGQAFT